MRFTRTLLIVRFTGRTPTLDRALHRPHTYACDRSPPSSHGRGRAAAEVVRLRLRVLLRLRHNTHGGIVRFQSITEAQQPARPTLAYTHALTRECMQTVGHESMQAGEGRDPTCAFSCYFGGMLGCPCAFSSVCAV